jgi:hypothetical protein
MEWNGPFGGLIDVFCVQFTLLDKVYFDVKMKRFRR